MPIDTHARAEFKKKSLSPYKNIICQEENKKTPPNKLTQVELGRAKLIYQQAFHH